MIEVVVPAHNAAPFLRETLESVAAQTRPPALVTVVDDRSTDATREVAERAAAELPVPIRVLATEGPPGPSAARNTAIRRADGPPLVALLDADDLLLPNHHADLAALLGADPGAVLAFGDCSLFDSASGETLVPSHHTKSGIAARAAEPLATLAVGFTLGERMFVELLATGMFGTSACLFHRAAALRAGLFDEAMMYAEDTDLFLRLALLGGMPFTREPVSRKRVHGGNLSRLENRLRFARGTAESLARLQARAAAGEIAPTPAQRAALEERVPRAVNGYLYEASLCGPAAYRRAALLARRSGLGPLALHPRHLARLALRGLRRGGGATARAVA